MSELFKDGPNPIQSMMVFECQYRMEGKQVWKAFCEAGFCCYQEIFPTYDLAVVAADRHRFSRCLDFPKGMMEVIRK